MKVELDSLLKNTKEFGKDIRTFLALIIGYATIAVKIGKIVKDDAIQFDNGSSSKRELQIFGRFGSF